VLAETLWRAIKIELVYATAGAPATTPAGRCRRALERR
jgi:hypothetical protein